MTAIVNPEQLQKATGYERPCDVEKCLKKNGVRVLYGKNGAVFTTIDAINAALGLVKGAEQEDEINIL